MFQIHLSLLVTFCCLFSTISEERSRRSRLPEDVCELERDRPSTEFQQSNQSCSLNIYNICDPDHLLQADTRNIIEVYTSAISKASITVAVIAKMDEQMVSSGVGVDSCGKVYADAIFKQLYTHRKTREIDSSSSAAAESIANNSLVIFVSIAESALQFSCGKDLSQLLPAAALGEVLRTGRSYIRHRQVSYGIESSIIALDLLLSGGHGQIVQKHGSQFLYRYGAGGDPLNDVPGRGSSFSAAITVSLFFVIFVASMIAVGKYLDAMHQRRKDQGRATLRTMVMEVLRNEHVSDRQSCFLTTCPECLEPYTAAAGPGAGPGQEPEQAARRKSTLEPCRHDVCSVCLAAMVGLFGARVCPLCRSPIVRYHHIHEATTVGTVADRSVNQEASSHLLFESHRNDICHRLQRVYERFPGVITEKWLAEATLAIDRGTLGDFERIVPVSWRSGTKTAESQTNNNDSVNRSTSSTTSDTKE